MSLETDLLLDRRRLKRRLNFWRALTIVAVVGAALLVVRPGADARLGGGILPHVARVNVNGVITEDRKLLEAVDALAKDRSVSAVIISVNSPGGSVAGGESLRAALARVAAEKPTVAVMGGTAASAGYMVSLPAQRIFAREGTITGSIGVILETAEVSGLLGKVGVGAQAITSGPLKDQPSFIRPLSPEGRDYLQGLVMDMYDQFVSMVAAGRNMGKERVKELADGRAYTGRQAKALGLVDELGGEHEARAWLARTHHVPETTPVRDVQVQSRLERLVGGASGAFTDALLRAGLGVRTLPAGAWAIWQGSAE